MRRLPSIQRRAAASDDAGVLPVLLVVTAVLFNAGLAIINGHVATLSKAVVAGAELAIVASCGVVVLRHYQHRMLPWTVLVYLVVMFAVLRGLVTQSFEPKYVRDVLLIPTFVLLGMTVPLRRVIHVVLALHVIVVSGVVFEAFFTEAYAALFEVQRYYIDTRGFNAEAFWDTSSELFVSATRPDERFYGLVDFHRISSVFMEPVTLGNYVIVITLFVCAFYRRLSPPARAFLIFGNVVALIGCDGRLATVLAALIVVVSLVAPRLPRGSAILYLPGAIVGATVFVALTNPEIIDTFPGRIAFCINLLTQYGLRDWLGLSEAHLMASLDSGIAYMIMSQSVLGLIVFWLVLILSADESTAEQRIYLHGLCLFIALTMLVSYSLFSIKTAALLWFIHGALQRRPEASLAPVPGFSKSAASFERSMSARAARTNVVATSRDRCTQLAAAERSRER